MKADSPSRLRAERPRADDGKARTERLTLREVDGERRRVGREEREANVITLSLVHCCLLSDLIWSRRHT